MTSIVAAGRVLAALDLVTAFGHVSQRTAAGYDITALGDLGSLQESQTVAVDLASSELPPGAPGEAWLHTAVYRARPEVTAVVRAQPVPCLAAASATDALEVLHGQAAWLAARGGRVPVHPVPRLLRSAGLAEAAATTLGGAGAMLLRSNGAVTVGAGAAGVEVAVARMHLLSVACDVWLRASAVGRPTALAGADLEAWESVGDDLLARLWQHLAARAQVA